MNMKNAINIAFKKWVSSLNGETEYEQPQSDAFVAGFAAGMQHASKPPVEADAKCNCVSGKSQSTAGCPVHGCTY